MFVDRLNDGSITACYYSRQSDGQEEVKDDAPELLMFQQQQIARIRANQGKVQIRTALSQAKTVDDLKAIVEQLL